MNNQDGTMLLCCLVILGMMAVPILALRTYAKRKKEGLEAFSTTFDAIVGAPVAVVAAAIKAKIAKGNNGNGLTGGLQLRRWSDYSLVYIHGNSLRTNWQFEVKLDDADEDGAACIVSAAVTMQTYSGRVEGSKIALRLFEDVKEAVLSVDPRAKISY